MRKKIYRPKSESNQNKMDYNKNIVPDYAYKAYDSYVKLMMQKEKRLIEALEKQRLQEKKAEERMQRRVAEMLEKQEKRMKRRVAEILEKQEEKRQRLEEEMLQKQRLQMQKEEERKQREVELFEQAELFAVINDCAERREIELEFFERVKLCEMLNNNRVERIQNLLARDQPPQIQPAQNQEVQNQPAQNQEVHNQPLQKPEELVGNDEQTETEEVQCKVCLDNKFKVILNCNHFLCISCYNQIIKANCECPQCRTSITKGSIVFF